MVLGNDYQQAGNANTIAYNLNQALTSADITLIQDIVMHQAGSVNHFCNFCQPPVALGKGAADSHKKIKIKTCGE